MKIGAGADLQATGEELQRAVRGRRGNKAKGERKREQKTEIAEEKSH